MIIKKKLKWWLTKSTDKIFKSFSRHVHNGQDKNKRFIFIDNGADILAVAHVDTVLPVKRQRVSFQDDFVFARGLDDRLGCHVAVDILPELGIKADVLLTDNEEIGQSTAQFVEGVIPNRYRFIVEFDRGGADFVDYGQGSLELTDALTSLGIPRGFGSFSDIAFLPPSFDDIATFNMGIGYYKAHQKDSYSDLLELQEQLIAFAQLCHQHKDTVFKRDYGSRYFYDDEYLMDIDDIDDECLSYGSRWDRWDDWEKRDDYLYQWREYKNDRD